MEYLVTMTTHVPGGTSPREVAEVRAREAAHTEGLAAQGRVLRLWRPPLAPGEWRTIGLFAAGDADDLERTLASMPLRVWRHDEPVALGQHPNDPGAAAAAPRTDLDEYLVTFTLEITPTSERLARDADRARQLTAVGSLLRLWTLDGHDRSLGLWQTPGRQELDEILRSLPLAERLSTETIPLTRHPSDPATTARRPEGDRSWT